MVLPAFIKQLVNIGVRRDYLPWESHLTRKINLVSLLGFFNVSIGLITFLLIGYYNSVFECVTVLCISPLVFILNRQFGYVAGVYMFTFIGCFLFFFLGVKMGESSLAFLYFFTLMVGLIQMVGRRETFKHFIGVLLMCLASVGLLIYSYQISLFRVELPEFLLTPVKYVNIFFSFFATAGFMIIITIENIKQERQLSSAIQQKEVLLAELFHRVKNNLNIVTSLLNLKKESINSEEARAALEECRNLIFSMALVHDNIYKSNNIDNLDLKEYVNRLGKELVKTLSGSGQADLKLNASETILHISKAIPCGLIINELITNSFKHARADGKQLEMTMVLAKRNEHLEFEFRDNGPGIQGGASRKNSLGLDLIKSLCEQLDAEETFRNENGLVFQMKFKI